MLLQFLILLLLLAAASIECLLCPFRFTVRTCCVTLLWWVVCFFSGPLISRFQLPIFSFVQSHHLPIYLGLPFLIVFDDFSLYWSHRFSHAWAPWWFAHRVHHSSTTYNLLLGLRNSPLESLFMIPFLCVPLLLGFSLVQLFTVRAVSILIQHFMHTRLSFRFPRWVSLWLVTPDFHELHHASNPCYWDRNFGALFSIWDRLFGTAVSRTEFPIYGVQ